MISTCLEPVELFGRRTGSEQDAVQVVATSSEVILFVSLQQ